MQALAGPAERTVFLPLASVNSAEGFIPVASGAEVCALSPGEIGLWVVPDEQDTVRQPPASLKRGSYHKLGQLIRRAVDELDPGTIHATEIGTGGLSLATIAIKPNDLSASIIVSNWRGELDWFRGLPAYHSELMRLMRRAAVFVAEGDDDLRLASQLGFVGVGEVLPLAGAAAAGVSTIASSSPPSRRTEIVVDCRHAVPTSATHLLSACFLAADALRGYRIHAIGGGEGVAASVGTLRDAGLDVMHEPARISEEDASRHLAAARILLGARVSGDAMMSVFTAMRTGAFPILTVPDNAGTWVAPEEGALFGNPHDIADTAVHLRRAAADDALVDAAASHNASVLEEAMPSFSLDRIKAHYVSPPRDREGG